MTIIQYYYPDLTSTIMDAFTAPVSYYRKLAFFAVNFSERTLISFIAVLHLISAHPSTGLVNRNGGT